MGTFGPGPLENDTALDFVADANEARISAVFEAVNDQLQAGEIDATVSEEAIAAAELVASALGRGLPDTADKTPSTLNLVPDEAMLEMAANAMSAIMGASQLRDLWGEADEPAEFNAAMHSLMRRLNPKVPFKPEVWEKDDPLPKNATCCFCGKKIEGEAMIELSARLRHDQFNDMTKHYQAHTICMNRRVHPRFFVQDWTTEI